MANRSSSARDQLQPEITLSRCLTESATATLTLDVTNYLELDGMGVGEFVSSRVFSVGGHDWVLRFYPDGEGYSEDGYAGNTSAFVRYQGEARGVRAKFTMEMLHKQGISQAAVVASYGSVSSVFSPGMWKEDWGYQVFVHKSKLRELSELGGDGGCSFTIRCVLTVVTNESPPIELPGSLERALKDGKGADVTFNVSGSAFRAHRFMLAARSPVFEAQLFGPMAEKDMGRVEVVDVEPAIFEMMLHYIYTDSLPPCGGDDDEGGGGGGAYGAAVLQHLLVAADRYGIDRLKTICEEKLCESIGVETVTSTLALANQHFCERLKDACLEFMSSPEVLGAVPGDRYVQRAP
ncbi:hypothetical protein BRADI_5g22472v3 [Brachypodium distachyon]|uniref:BTB domain-containing protein n=1 Tax=Brachypodium distachyon TaxID=15368 RepID=A0A0Q3P6X9_BRADI|nr:hypothetical protein BRADI_5g22472v3 [Brachypodium distachyon]